MRYIIGFFLLLASLNSWAQKSKIELLEESLRQSVSTQEKIATQIELADRMTEIDVRQSEKYIAEAINLARTLGDDALILDAQVILASLHLSTKKIKESEELLDIILKDSNRPITLAKAHFLKAQSLEMGGKKDSIHHHYSLGNKMGRANNLDYRLIEGYYNFGAYYLRQKEFELSDSLFSLAYEMATHTEEYGQKAKLAYAMGSSFVNRGKFQKGIELFIEGYKSSKKTIFHDRTVALLNQLAIGSYYSNDTIQAKTYWDEGFNIIKQHQISSEAALDLLRDYSILMIEMNNLNTAEKALIELLKIAELESNTVEALGALGHLSNIHADQKLFDLSNQEIDKVLSKIYKFTDHRKIYNALNGVIPALIKTKRYQEASTLLPFFKKNIELYKSSASSSKYYEYAYEIFKNIGRYEDALSSFEVYTEIDKKFVATMNAQKILNAKVKFEADEKELRNQSLTEKNKVVQASNKKLIFGLISLILLLFGLTYLYNKFRIANRVIKEQNKKLQSVNATKDRLFAIISHDLRSEISAFQNLNNILNFHLQNQNFDRIKEIVAQVDKSAITVNTLMNNLLQWSSSQLEGITLHPEALDLKKQAESVIQLFEQYSQTKEIDLNISLPEQCMVYADANSLQFVIRNVISNAMKFSNNGGKVKISANESSEGIALKIQDTGIGVPKEKLAKIWLLDKKSSRLGTHGERGTGIGLSMVKDFVSRNNGKIHIESEENNGTTVTILLPKAS